MVVTPAISALWEAEEEGAQVPNQLGQFSNLGRIFLKLKNQKEPQM